MLGPNGGGKTTLFRALLGELATVAGTVDIDGATALRAPDRALAAGLPRHRARRRAHGRVCAHARGTGASRRPIASWRASALERVGLAEHARKRFGALSGGQRQRVLIARALVQDAGVLLLDEPFAGVDQTSEEAIMGILDDLRAEGRILLIATHDVEQARRWDRVLCLRGEQIAYGPPADTLTNAVLEATYGAEIVLLDCGHRAVAVQHHTH